MNMEADIRRAARPLEDAAGRPVEVIGDGEARDIAGVVGAS